MTKASALVALLAVVGCALPVPFGSSQHSDNLLNAITGHDADKQLSPPPELIREPSPYPTAVNAAKVATPLPLQQTGTPAARPLDPQQLAGRLPLRFEPRETVVTPAEATSPPTPEPVEQTVYQPPVYQQPASPPAQQQPIALTASPANALASNMLSPTDKAWPVTTPLENLNSLVEQAAYTQQQQQPINVKAQPPVVATTAAVEAPAPQPFVPPDMQSPAPAAPTGIEATESAETLLPKLIASLQKEIRERTDRKEVDQLPALQQKLRLLQLVANDTDDAVDQIEQLPPAEREAFKHMMFALTTWLSPEDAKRASLRNAKILRALHEANNRLSSVSKLDLKNLMFCEKVESFGWYTEFPRAEFTPKQQVILYVEVQNFAAEEKSTNAFETELQGSYQIFDGEGNIVDERQLPLDREVCRNFRRDYFLAYRIYLPAELAAGRYRLELTIEDLKAKKDFKGRKQGEALIEFAIK
jgi:hypothetical protein